MPCAHCSHCQALSAGVTLTLPAPPAWTNEAGANAPFYRAFAAAYDHARAMGLRPRVALREANPWLTDSQCTSYLARARSLGLVQSKGRAPRKATRQRTPDRAKRGGLDWTPEQSQTVWFPGEMDTPMDLVHDNAARTGRPITAAQVRQAAPQRLTEQQAQAVLDWAVAEGWARWADDGSGVHAV